MVRQPHLISSYHSFDNDRGFWNWECLIPLIKVLFKHGGPLVRISFKSLLRSVTHLVCGINIVREQKSNAKD